MNSPARFLISAISGEAGGECSANVETMNKAGKMLLTSGLLNVKTWSMSLMTVLEHKLWNRWMNLVKKFKSEKKAIDEKQPSGSAASKKISSRVFHNDMVWITSYVEHLTELSSDNLQEGDSQKQQHAYKKRSSKSSSDEQFHSMEQIFQQNAATIQQIRTSLEGSGDFHLTDSYFPLIAMRHSLMPKDRQYECTKDVLSYIQFYVNKKKAIGEEDEKEE
ncbi:hypothetical protein QAD02_002367 [Eretmocerus hayati]|uniref:Uncharacterized protein n=1 Tax=Eretmocerus hayati TaxID=131215 RepID=A0ACC2NIU6_9HYME|nr:hypothetical protein QAD02_002367 [Eretmocerus hayati]